MKQNKSFGNKEVILPHTIKTKKPKYGHREISVADVVTIIMGRLGIDGFMNAARIARVFQHNDAITFSMVELPGSTLFTKEEISAIALTLYELDVLSEEKMKRIEAYQSQMWIV